MDGGTRILDFAVGCGFSDQSVERADFFLIPFQKNDTPLTPQYSRPAGEGAGTQERDISLSSLKKHLRRRYNLFWRSKVRLLLVCGEPEHIAAIAPGLAEKQWFEGHRTVLIYGGSLSSAPDTGHWPPCVSCAAAVRWTASCWRWMRDRPPPVRWITIFAPGAGREALRWQPPVYLWQVTDSDWSQDARVTQTVGALFPARATPAGWSASSALSCHPCAKGEYSSCAPGRRTISCYVSAGSWRNRE